MSQQLDLDFAPSRAFSLSRFTLINLLIILASLLIAIYVAITYINKDSEYSKLQAELAQTQPEKKPDEPNNNTEKIPAAELKQITEITTDLTVPWEILLTELEQVNMQDIALLSLEPSKKKQQVILGGQGKNMLAVLNYIEALEKLPMLSHVFLQKHNVDELDPFKPVAFSIVARWS
jgi:hypothetical protein